MATRRLKRFMTGLPRIRRCSACWRERRGTSAAMATGIHHVTAITGNVQKNVDFYAGFLGLRLVKQTGGFEDAEPLHRFHGDQLGSPGSAVTLLVWPDGSRGRAGL